MNNEVKIFAVDIETVSQGKRSNEYTDKNAKAAANLKDPLKIEASLLKSKEKGREKHGLSWTTGKIISISIVEVYGTVEEVFFGHDEADILRKFLEVAGKGKLVGKNSINFDFPFIIGRLMANNIPVSQTLRNRHALLDVDHFFGMSASMGQRGKLSDYCQGLFMEDKPMNGGEIQGKYEEIMILDFEGKKKEAQEKWVAIANYNLYDSQIVANMFKRYWGVDREFI